MAARPMMPLPTTSTGAPSGGGLRSRPCTQIDTGSCRLAPRSSTRSGTACSIVRWPSTCSAQPPRRPLGFPDTHVSSREPSMPVAAPSAPTDRYLIISADCHGGGAPDQYREYLDAKWRDEFDAWRGAYKNPYRDLRDSDARTRNWDDARRWKDLEADGQVAEVVFPNTVPPFFPTGIVIARPPTSAEYERRWVGIKAHNRWMADFVSLAPQRRAGIAQVFLNDVDDAVA